jgi:hypothetical protein
MNTAAPSCWQSDQESLTISSVSENYPSVVIRWSWVRNSLNVPCRFWLHCHISKTLWTLTIQCNVHFCAYHLISVPFSAFRVFQAGSWHANIPWMAPAHNNIWTILWRVSPVVLDYHQPITSHIRDTLASTWTQYCIMEIVSHTTLEECLYIECLTSCWHHNVTNIWYTLCTANLHWVGLEIILVRLNLLQVFWKFRWWFCKVPCGFQYACCTIPLSKCHLSHTFRHFVFYIITGQMSWIIRRLTRSSTHFGGKEIVVWQTFGLNDD